MRRMKDSGIEWIGEIPEHWKLMPIKIIFNERNENNDAIKTTEILSLTIEQGVIPHSEKTGVGGNKPKEDISKYKLTYPNDIVINSMNVLAGAVGISKYFGAVSPVYYTLYPSSNEFSSEYYNNIFQTKPFQESLLGLGNGIMMKKSESSGKLNTIRMRIPMSKLNTLSLPVPPIDEQFRISGQLNGIVLTIDNIIEKTKRSIDEYKKYKQSLITEAVTKGLSPNVKMKNSGIEWIGQIPEHWKIVKSKYVLNKLLRKRIENGDTVICSNGGKSTLKGDSNIGLVSLTQHDYQGVEIGDVLIHGMDTWHGAIALSEHRGDCTSVVHVCDSKQNKQFLVYFLQMLSFNGVYKLISNGVRQNTSDFRSWSKFGEILIALPSIDEQHQIIEFINNKVIFIDSLINQKEILINELESYKKALIYEVVTGKKEIN